MAAVAAAVFQGLSRPEGSSQGSVLPSLAVSPVIHFSVGVGARSRGRDQSHRRALRFNSWEPGSKCGGLGLRRRFVIYRSKLFDRKSCRLVGIGDDDGGDGGRGRGTRVAAPRAAATAVADWGRNDEGDRWEDAVVNRIESLRLRNLKLRNKWEGLAVIGLVALAGLVAVRLSGGFAILSVGAIVLCLCLGDLHHRHKSIYVAVNETLESLKGSIWRRVRIAVTEFERTPRAETLLRTPSWNSPLLETQDSRAELKDLSRDAAVGVKEMADCVAKLTSIISNLDTKVASVDEKSRSELSNLNFGIVELRGDLDAVANALSAMQSTLKITAGMETRTVKENELGSLDGQAATQTKIESGCSNGVRESIPSQSSESLASEDEWKRSHATQSTRSDGPQQMPNPSSMKAVSAALKSPISSAISIHEVSLESSATVFEIGTGTSSVSGEAAAVEDELMVASNSMNNSHREAVNGELSGKSEDLRHKDLPLAILEEIAPKHPSRSSSSGTEIPSSTMEEVLGPDGDGSQWLANQITASSAGPYLMKQEITDNEDDLSVLVEARASVLTSSSKSGDQTPMEGHHHVIEMRAMESSSTDLWQDNGKRQSDSEGQIVDVDVGSRWKSSDMQESPAAVLSMKWSDDESGLANHFSDVSQTRKAADKEGIGNSWSNVKYGVDFCGKNSGTVGKIQRGMLAKSKATGGRGSFGLDDDVDSEWTQDRGRRWKEEQDLQNQIRSRDSDAGQPWVGQLPGTSGREFRSDDGKIWEDEPSTDRYVQSNYVRDSPYYSEGDSDARKNDLLEDREWPVEEREFPDEMGEQPQYGGGLEGRYSPREPTSSRTRVPSDFRDEEEKFTRVEVGRFSRKGRYRDEESSSRVDKGRDVPRTSDREWRRGSEAGSQSERRDDSFSPSQFELEERNLLVRQSRRGPEQKFSRLLDEGEVLLTEGMQGLEGRIEVGVAERMLYDAASLFQEAAEMDPSSLIAVGLWGNTLLVHGELKLKLSQQLRSMLPSSASSFYMAKVGEGLDAEQQALELTLQDVCEECEELLVDAGRKYRMALSMNRTDVRALYNWGLALCYRGQLIAEEGGERAVQDADKVYLAAIDKFEAMLGIGQEYASGALLNWGLALRDRSRLRPMGEKDRVKLLLQAKELFQDVLRLDPNNGQARGAVAAAMAELQELEEFEELRREQESDGRPSRSWW